MSEVTSTPPEGQDRDGGYASRKMWMCLVVIVLAAIIGFIPSVTMQANYGTFCGTAIGALGIFSGANVAVKWAAKKAKSAEAK